MNTAQQYDIVIVGAGFAGLTLAHYLPTHLQILVIDSKPTLNHAIESTGLITQATYDLFSNFTKIDDYIPNKITHIGVIAPNYKDHFISTTDTPWIYSTDTPALVQHMAQAVPSNVTVQINTEYSTSTVTKEDEYPVAIECTYKKAPVTYAAKFIVGADGAYSRVAKKNSLSQNTKFLVGFEKVFMGNIHVGPDPEHSVYHYWFGEFSLGYGGWLSPTVINNKPAFRLGLAKLKKDAGEWKLIDAFIKRLEAENMITIEGTPETNLSFSSLIPLNGPLKNVYNQHALLLGDAAGLCGAFAADGIKGALVSGIEAAKLLPQHLDGNAKSFTQYYPKIQTHNKLMTYYRKQVWYRFIWDIMQTNRTFTTLYRIIERQKEGFLHQFCDSKEERKSLLSIVLVPRNIGILLVYSVQMIGDWCIVGYKKIRKYYIRLLTFKI